MTDSAPSSGEIEVAGFLLVRTPLLPFRVFENLASQEGGAHDRVSNNAAGRSSAIAAAALSDAVVSEALRFASPSFHSQLTKAVGDPGSPLDAKLERSLIKYMTRMTTRCAPFGMLAGTSSALLRIDAPEPREQGIRLARRESYRRHSRLDMGCIARLQSLVFAERHLQRQLRYFLNPTLYRIGDDWRYLRRRETSESKRFQLGTIRATSYLDSTLQYVGSQKSEVGYGDLVRYAAQLVEGATVEEASEFVDELIDEGALISSFTPPMTCGDPLPLLIDELPPSSDVRASLEELNERIAELNATSIGHGMRVLDEVERAIDARLVENAPRTSSRVQTDLFKPITACDIPRSVIRDISKTVKVLSALAPASIDYSQPIRAAFIDRYGEAEIPLLEAFDMDRGLAAFRGQDATPLTRGLKQREDSLLQGQEPTSSADLLILQEFERSVRAGSDEMELPEDTIERLGDLRAPRLPSTFFVVASVLDAAGESRRIRIRSCGPVAAKYMGRFSASDPQLADLTRELLRREEELQADCIFAELVHWPGDRVGNVILRPRLRTKELPIHGRSMLGRDDVIKLSDLTLSVRGDEFVLRCTKSGKRVLPRLANAHNATKDDFPLYRFLSGLQLDESAITGFTWPRIFGSARELPRVRYGSCIIAPRTWHLFATDSSKLKSLGSEASIEQIHVWKRDHDWPRFVELLQDLQPLCVDLENPASTRGLVAELRRTSAATIREFFAPATHDFVRGPEGSYCHEIVVPFIRATRGAQPFAEPLPDRQSEAASLQIRSSRTCYTPGSEWLSVKVYCGTAMADDLLTKVIAPMMHKLIGRGEVSNWYFLRYGDPDAHLRIRLKKGSSLAFPGAAIRDLHATVGRLCENGRVARVEFDTYVPETNRYGGPEGIRIAEDFFFVDSQYASELIASRELVDPHHRWKRIAANVNVLWERAGVDADSRADVYRRMASQLTDSRPNAIRLDEVYRAARKDLEKLIHARSQKGAPGFQAMERWADSLSSLFAQLRLAIEAHHRPGKYTDIVMSYAHMHVNRLCLSSAPTQEYAIYYLLAKTLRTISAKARPRGT